MPTAQEQKTAQIPRRVIWLALAGAVGGFLFGFDSSVVNGAVDVLSVAAQLRAMLQDLYRTNGWPVTF